MTRLVLFVSVDDAGAGPLAAALFNVRAPLGVRAVSAGTAPADATWPAVEDHLAVLGAPVHIPTRVTSGDVSAADVVVTLANPETCPVEPRTLYVDWSFPGLDNLAYPAVLERVLPRLERSVAALVDLVVRDASGDEAEIDLRS
jgi:protein-tyrosine-phosphatase